MAENMILNYKVHFRPVTVVEENLILMWDYVNCLGSRIMSLDGIYSFLRIKTVIGSKTI